MDNQQFAQLIGQYADMFVFNHRREGLDVLKGAQILATFDSASYYTDCMPRVRNFDTPEALLRWAVSLVGANPDGIALEFGVASGRTVNQIAEGFNGPVYGFDSFEGLPETWRTGFEQGAFAGKLPEVRENVELVVGLFDDTLPGFQPMREKRVNFLHVDCDLYSSTKTVFEQVGPYLDDELIVLFDEYWNYPGWRQHEHQALQEFCEATGARYEYIGIVGNSQQVAVQMVTRPNQNSVG